MSSRSDSLVCSQEGSNKIGCTPQHFRLLIRQGKLEGVKLGRDWFVATESLDRYLADRVAKIDEVREAKSQYKLFEVDRSEIVNVASVPQRSPFRYPGGKTWLVPIARRWLDAVATPKGRLVEPFAGGGGISLMAAFERRVTLAEMTELDASVASVWSVALSNEVYKLADRIRTFQCDLESVQRLLAVPAEDLVGQAFQTIVRNRVSRGGILAPGAGLVKNGEAGKGIRSRWYPETLANRLIAIYDHRGALSITIGDGMDAIRRRTCDVVYFVDPPYPKAGKRLYTHNELDHRRLLELLARLDRPFLATYDDNPEIEAMAL